MNEFDVFIFQPGIFGIANYRPSEHSSPPLFDTEDSVNSPSSHFHQQASDDGYNVDVINMTPEKREEVDRAGSGSDSGSGSGSGSGSSSRYVYVLLINVFVTKYRGYPRNLVMSHPAVTK